MKRNLGKNLAVILLTLVITGTLSGCWTTALSASGFLLGAGIGSGEQGRAGLIGVSIGTGIGAVIGQGQRIPRSRLF